MSKKGFTLIELMVVISIISLLSSVILASLTEARKKGLVAAGQLFESNVNAKIGDGLIAQYNFDEGNGAVIRDISGNGNDLALVGATRVKGVLNDAISIDSQNDNAQGFIKDFNPDEGTLSMWIKPDEYTLGPQFPIFSAGPAAGDNAYFAYISFNMQEPGTPEFPGMWNCGAQWPDYIPLVTNTTPDALLRKWNHVVISWTVIGGAKVSVYLNGKLIGEKIYSPRPYFFEHTCGTPQVTIPGNPVFIYLGSGNQNRYATYQMDRVRLYNKAYEL